MWTATVAEIVALCSTPKATKGRARAAALTTSASGQQLATLYEFRWNRLGRKGQTCKCLARGTMNSCLLEFGDGFKMVTSRNALRRCQ